MKFKLVEYIGSDPVASDIVFLRKDVPYKSEKTKELVDTNHQFFVLQTDGEDVLLLMTTTSEKRDSSFPNDYVKVSGKNKDFLVEINSWGTFPKDYIYRVYERVPKSDYDKVVDAFYNSISPTDLKLENL